jgi:hypothetical protein
MHMRSYSSVKTLHDLAAQLLEMERGQWHTEQQSERDLRADWKAADQEFVAFVAVLQGIVADAFSEANYHRNDRSRWRKKWPMKGSDPKTMDDDSLSADCPKSIESETYTAELATLAESAWLELISGGDFDREAALRRELDELQRRYSKSGDGVLESLLVRDVALSHLRAAFADYTYAGSRGLSLAQARFLVERQRVCHQRLAMAIRTLAEVRKLTNKKVLRRPS